MRPNRKKYAHDDPRVLALNEARAVAGGTHKLARRLNMLRQAVQNWQVVPAERVLAVEAATHVSRYRLRPDVFGTPDGAVLGDMAHAAQIALRVQEFSKKLGVPLDQIAAWERIPPEMVLKVEKLTGISRFVLRPDVFGEAEDAEEVTAAA